jgi:F0F1-type ATP synthase assembly protein I
MREDNKIWSALGFAWNLGYSIAIPLVLLALGGRFLDKAWSTSPWMLLGGILISIVISSFIVYKKTIQIIKSDANDPNQHSNDSNKIH